jgi:hypothetical protein
MLNLFPICFPSFAFYFLPFALPFLPLCIRARSLAMLWTAPFSAARRSSCFAPTLALA